MSSGSPEPVADRQVVILTGPSGAGKSRLAERLNVEHGWPVVRLDDFYKDGDDPTLPTSTLGIADWDDVGSFHLDAAVAALETLCRTGVVSVPTYDIGASRAIGTATITAEPGSCILAEGIFAGHTIQPLRERGLLRAAFCVRQGAWLTFVRRLTRDLSERRKPPLVLVRRGLRLRAAEAGLVAEQERLGARAATPHEAEDALRNG